MSKQKPTSAKGEGLNSTSKDEVASLQTENLQLTVANTKMATEIEALLEANSEMSEALSAVQAGGGTIPKKKVPPFSTPKHYSGKVRGTYLSLSHNQIAPVSGQRFDVSKPVPSKEVGEVTLDSWLDTQLRGGTILFTEETE